MADSQSGGSFTRRSFLRGAGGVAASGIVAGQAAAESEAAEAPGAEQDGVRRLTGQTKLPLRVNGGLVEVETEPRTTLLSALRHRANPPLTGTKSVCEHGSCGACTVIIDGRAACACLVLAADCVGRDIRTVEGLADGETLSPVQEAFWECDAQMCGFCTPGFVMATTALLEKKPAASLDEIKAGLQGNICRCGTYPHIFEAADKAGSRMRRAQRPDSGGGR